MTISSKEYFTDIVNVLSHRIFIHTFTNRNCEQMFKNNSQLR